MKRSPLIVAVTCAVLLGACGGSRPKPDAAAQQACQAYAQLIHRINMGKFKNKKNGKKRLRAAVQEIVREAKASKDADISKAADQLTAAAEKSGVAVKAAAQDFIKACVASGVTMASPSAASPTPT